MKPVLKRILTWSSAFVLSAGVSFACLFDFGALNKSNNNNSNSNGNDNNTIVKPTVSPQQALLNSIISLKEAEVKGNIEATFDNQTVNVGVDGKLGLDTANLENTRFEGTTSVKFNGLNLGGDINYYNGKIFFDYEDSKLFLETTSLLDFVDMIPNYGVNVALPEELTNLDINGIMSKLETMEPEKTTGGYLFKLELNDNIDLLFKSDEDYNFIGVKTNKFYFENTYIYLDFDVNQKLDAPLTFTEPNIVEYQNFAPTFDLVNGIYNLFNKENNTLNLKVDISYLEQPYLSLGGDLSYDKTLSSLSFDGNVNELNYDREHNFKLGYKESNLVVDYNNLKFKVETQSIGALLGYIIDKVSDAYLTDAMTGLNEVMQDTNVLGLLDDLSSLNNLIKKIEVTENSVAVTLNLDILGIEADDIVLHLNFDKDSFKGIEIKGLNVNGYFADISLTSKEYNPVEFNLAEYTSIDPALCLIDAFESLSEEERFRLEFKALVDDQTESNSDINIGGGLQFDLGNEYGYGELDLLDPTNYNHNIKVDMRSYDEIIFAYNQNTKGRFSSNFFTDVISMISEILNNKDDHFYELFGDLMNSMTTLPVMDAINNKDYGKLFEIGLVDSLDVSTSGIKLGIKGGLIGIDSTLNIELVFDAYESDKTQILKGLKVTDFKYGDNVYSFEVNLKKFDDSLEDTRLDAFDTYIDFDSLAVLLRLGINTSVYNHYHFDGSANLSIIGIGIDIPLDIKVLNEKGNVSLAIELEKIPLIPGVNSEINGLHFNKDRKVSIYFKDGYFYLRRIEQASPNWLVWDRKTYELTAKVESQYFLDNIIYYLCDFSLGFSDSILGQIGSGSDSGSDTSADSTIHYENLLTDYSYNDQVETPYFHLAINMQELTKLSMFSDLGLNVYVNDGTKTLSGLSVNLNINVLITIPINANLNLVDLGKEFTMDELNNFVSAHANDEVNKTIEKF